MSNLLLYYGRGQAKATSRKTSEAGNVDVSWCKSNLLLHCVMVKPKQLVEKQVKLAQDQVRIEDSFG